MDGHDSPRIGNNDIDYKPTKLLSAFLKGRVQQSVKVAYFKASHRYEKKLEGKDLRNKIIDTLLKKGYNYEDIKNILEVKENNDE